MSAELLREWRPDFRLDLAGVLAPLRRGRGDPTWRSGDGPPDEDRAPGFGSAVWRTGTTPDWAATTRLHRRADGTVVAAAWGPGAEWALQGLPDLLGARRFKPMTAAQSWAVVSRTGPRRIVPALFTSMSRAGNVSLPRSTKSRAAGGSS
jgi:hypothetical protein